MSAPSGIGDNPQPSERATCAIVGTVSPTRLFLEPHGNFNPMFENSALETSKIQFQLVPPAIHPEFTEDFTLGIERIEKLQNKAITEGPTAEHFVILDGQKKGLKFSWPLFEKRVRPSFYRGPRQLTETSTNTQTVQYDREFLFSFFPFFPSSCCYKLDHVIYSVGRRRLDERLPDF
jgi:hypothetical protein